MKLLDRIRGRTHNSHSKKDGVVVVVGQVNNGDSPSVESSSLLSNNSNLGPSTNSKEPYLDMALTHRSKAAASSSSSSPLSTHNLFRVRRKRKTATTTVTTPNTAGAVVLSTATNHHDPQNGVLHSPPGLLPQDLPLVAPAMQGGKTIGVHHHKSAPLPAQPPPPPPLSSPGQPRDIQHRRSLIAEHRRRSSVVHAPAPLVEEELDPVVQHALGMSPDEQISLTPEQYAGIHKAVTALDKSGNDCFERGQYDQAFQRYERALILKRRTLQDDGVGRNGSISNSVVTTTTTMIKADTASSTNGSVTSGGASAAAVTDIPAVGAGSISPDDSTHQKSVLASVATSINNMTYLKQRSGQATNDETMASYLKSLQIKRDILGPEHLSVGKTLNNIGSVFYLKKEYEPALSAYAEACRIMQAQLGARHLDVGTVISNIGDVHAASGHVELALEHYRAALDIRWQNLEPHDPKVIRLMENIARLETGIQPSRQDDDVSESEAEDYAMEDQLAMEHFQESCRTLHEEIGEDLKYFDLVERQMAIDMLKEKAQILREMRALTTSDDYDESMEASESEGGLLLANSEWATGVGEASESEPGTTDSYNSASQDADATHPETMAVVAGSSGVPVAPVVAAVSTTSAEVAPALLSKAQQNARLRRGRGSATMASFVADSSSEFRVSAELHKAEKNTFRELTLPSITDDDEIEKSAIPVVTPDHASNMKKTAAEAKSAPIVKSRDEGNVVSSIAKVGMTLPNLANTKPALPPRPPSAVAESPVATRAPYKPQLTPEERRTALTDVRVRLDRLRKERDDRPVPPMSPHAGQSTVPIAHRSFMDSTASSHARASIIQWRRTGVKSVMQGEKQLA